MHGYKLALTFSLSAGLIIIFAFILFFNKSEEVLILPDEIPFQEIANTDTVSLQDTTVSVTTSQENEVIKQDSALQEFAQIPVQINLAVPFLVQAPTGNWGNPFAEACEEVSVMMAAYYYAGDRNAFSNPGIAEQKIIEVVEKQKEILNGIWVDTGAELTKKFAEAIYPITLQPVYGPTIEQIKNELLAGRPVIVPAAGQRLGNPFFSGVGPDYHMLIIKGFNEKGFITNEPGTRRGESYIYSFDVLMNALADWDSEIGLRTDRPVAIFTSPRLD
jgi:hypothetical protein